MDLIDFNDELIVDELIHYRWNIGYNEFIIEINEIHLTDV